MRKILAIIIPIVIAIFVFILVQIVLNQNKGKGALQVTASPKSTVFVDGKEVGKRHFVCASCRK